MTISGSDNACSAFVRRVIDFTAGHVIDLDPDDKLIKLFNNPRMTIE